MDTKKQKLLLELLISSPDTFALCQTILMSSYFDPELRNTAEFMQKYYNEYSGTPTPAQVKAETGLVLEKHVITLDQVQYCAHEVEVFCKHAAMKQATLALPELIKAEKYAEAEELIKDAATVSLTDNLGLRYFKDVDERIQRMLKEDPTSPTGWTKIDDALFGGISRKELLLVAANSGGGKSITLANLSFNFMNNGFNVLYISLELSEDVVAQRFDTMYTGIGRKVWKDNTDKIVKIVTEKGKQAGRLDIIQMPTGTTATHIRAYLKEYTLKHNTIPDLLVLDYLDNMSPNEHVSADNVFEKDKRSAEQLRQIGVDYNMFVATASQLNRSAVGATSHDHSQIAGGISKINVCDVYWSIVMTEENRAMGQIIFNILKTRNSDGVGQHIFLKWDSKNLRIVDEEDSGELKFVKRQAPVDGGIVSKTENGDPLMELLNRFDK